MAHSQYQSMKEHEVTPGFVDGAIPLSMTLWLGPLSHHTNCFNVNSMFITMVYQLRM